MPSTYTLNNGIELIGTGEQSGTWGDTTNTNFDLVDTALDGQVSVTLSSAGSSGSPNNLPVSDGSASNGRNRMVTFVAGSDLGATAFVQLTPNDSEKIIYVRNSLSGSRSIILFQGTYNSSNDYAIPAGKTAVIYFDGAGTGAVAANVFNNAYFDALTVTGNVDVLGTVDAATVEFNNLSGTGSVSVTDILDQDNMSSNSATALATQQSIKAYVDSQVDTVDTLAEILAVGNTTGSTDIDVSGAQKVQFRDAAIYINSSADGQLDIVADTEIQIAATTIDINGAVNASGEIIAASLDISGNIDVDGTTNLDIVDIDGAVNMATTALVTGVLTTTAAAVFNGGFATAADVSFGDNDKAIFGAGSDLQIYHDGLTSIIKETGAGDLRLQGANIDFKSTSGQTYAYFNSTSGAAGLYYAGSQKLATTATGVAVTGNIAATGNLSGVDGTFTGDVTIGDDLFITGPNPSILLTDNDVASEWSQIANISGNTFYNVRNGTANGHHIFQQNAGGTTTEAMRIDSSGNVGIGTNNPAQKLSVTGNISATGTVTATGSLTTTGSVIVSRASGYGSVEVGGPSGALIDLKAPASDDFDARIIYTGGSELQITTLASGEPILLRQGNSTKLATSSTGVAVTGNLTATGNVSGVNGTFTGDVIIGDDLSVSGPNPVINIVETSVNQHRIVGAGGILYIQAQDSDGTTDGDMHLTGYNNNALNLLNIKAANTTITGNVGIGTASPSEALHVIGTIQASANFQLTANDSYCGFSANGMYVHNANDIMSFKTGAAERLRIDASGNVLVNATSGSSTDTMTIARKSGSAIKTTTGTSGNVNHIIFQNSNGAVGSIRTNGSATSYSVSSDYRLKENVTPIQGAADIVKAMRPCTYNFKADTNDWHDGFLAHELQEVHPRAVSGTKDAMLDEEYEVTPAVYEDVVTPAVDAVAATYDDEGLELTPAVEAAPETTENTLVTEAVMGTRSVPDMQSVDYSKLTPILTAALQEALTEIAALKVRVAALESA